MQRVVDSWHSPIGLTAIMVLIAFFASQPDMFNTDEDRQEWAEWYLKDLHFAYKDADGDDRKVCTVRFNFHNQLTNKYSEIQWDIYGAIGPTELWCSLDRCRRCTETLRYRQS